MNKLAVTVGILLAGIGYPQSRFIFAVEGGDLVRMGENGSAKVKLTQTMASERVPDVDASGRFLAYYSDESGADQVYVMDLVTHLVKQLTFSGQNQMPKWSPDGSKILFSRAITPGAAADVCVMNADGTSVVTIAGDPVLHETQAVWSPTGLEIAYSSGIPNGGMDLWKMNADGSGKALLLSHGWDEWYCDWSKSGSWITFHGLVGGNWEVERVDADGLNLVNLSQTAEADQGPTWTPEDDIIFTSQRDPKGIYRMAADGSGQTLISQGNFEFARLHVGIAVPYTLAVRSVNPTSIPMTVWNTDLHGKKSGTTSFDRVYPSATLASVTAPESVSNKWFERWEKDGIQVPGSTRTISVYMDANHLIRAIYVNRATLTVTSTNPGSGVNVAVWKADKLGRTHGTTTFSRVYTQGTAVTMTAPNVVGSNYFKRWDLDGAPWLATRTVSVPMSGNRTATAVYGTGQVLSVSSSQPNVSMTVWLTDANGLRDGLAAFTRLYPQGANASVTAPAQAGGKPFVRWEKDGAPVPGTSRTVQVLMDSAHTVSAIYAP